MTIIKSYATIKNYAFFFIVSFSMIGCSTPYYGYTKEDWNSLTKEKQDEVKAEYQSMVDIRENQRRMQPIDARTHSIMNYGVQVPKHGQQPLR